jgi:hypothetical protein
MKSKQGALGRWGKSPIHRKTAAALATVMMPSYRASLRAKAHVLGKTCKWHAIKSGLKHATASPVL